MTSAPTLDPKEIESFNKVAQEWWDLKGPFKPLHRMNPLRMRFIRDAISTQFKREPEDRLPFKGLDLVDVGCGGGLVTEPLARLGGRVTGIDAGIEAIKVAQAHAAEQNLKIDYQLSTVEELAQKKKKFDGVIALEIVEHVADVPAFLEACCALLKPGGVIVFSTLNRTLKSFALAILGAEYILRWMPKGTHQWGKFVRPSELSRGLQKNGVRLTSLKGMVFNPLTQDWSLGNDIQVNYILSGVK